MTYNIGDDSQTREEADISNWRVIFRTESGLFSKKFTDVKEAVIYAKDIKREGGTADVISLSKAYPPQEKKGPRPSSKHLWCPYCVNWRVFKVTAIRMKAMSNVLGPPLLRCPLCQVSVSDVHIRKYNPSLWDDAKLMGSVRDD